MAFFLVGFTDTALEIFSQPWEPPFQLEAWKNQFSLYLLRKEYIQADELVSQLLKVDQGKLWAQDAKIYLLKLFGTPADLENYLRENSSWKDSLFALQIAYGRILKQKGELTQAIHFYNMGLDGNPKNGEAWLELADIYLRSGNNTYASQCLDFAIQQGVRNPIFFSIIQKIVADQRYRLTLKRLEIEKNSTNCYLTVVSSDCYAYYQKIIQDDVLEPMGKISTILEKTFFANTFEGELARELAFYYGLLGKKENQLRLFQNYSFHFFIPFIPNPSPQLYYSVDRMVKLSLNIEIPKPLLVPDSSHWFFQKN